jgi:hypothetical protein
MLIGKNLVISSILEKKCCFVHYKIYDMKKKEKKQYEITLSPWNLSDQASKRPWFLQKPCPAGRRARRNVY